jgi:hypothetical protein
MQRRKFIRVIMLALALAAGLGSFAPGSDVGSIPDRMIEVASIDLPHSMNHRTCCDQTGVTLDACNALSVCGLAIVPVDQIIFALGAASFDGRSRDRRTDRASAPDPHPPKNLSLT